MRFLKPLDFELLDTVFAKYDTILTLEDGSKIGGLGSSVADYAFAKAYKGKIIKLGINDQFVAHGTVEELQEEAGISVSSIKEILKDCLN